MTDFVLLQEGPNIRRVGFNSERVGLSLNFIMNPATTRMFGGKIGAIVADITSTQNVTANFHHKGFFVKDFQSDEYLRQTFNVISTSKDLNGVVGVPVFNVDVIQRLVILLRDRRLSAQWNRRRL